eukprot:TRINITY_DN63808_c0_g1_i1.p1 TRINITY_DN63808_c0_g1~~TRINITY_DN63808_c0_g1_i1.p1  ORF type:complete len:332 (+),score=22.89 TRINITY_DN63808_c0_g1_i1:39-1034(+)
MYAKIVTVAALAAYVSAGNLRSREVYESAFADHITKYNIDIKNGAEFVHRLQIFADNYDMIETHNAGDSSYKMGLNQFSHLTLDEFHEAVNLGGIKKPDVRKSNKIHTATPGAEVPDSVDWSTTPAVSPVKNQGSCGSCWSFSATGGLEGAHYIKTGSGTSLSEQNLVSCDKVDNACNGGWMDDAFAFAQKNGGLCSEEDYPYVSGNGNVPACSTSCSNVDNTSPSSWTDVEEGSVDALMSAVAQQPVSVAIQANQVAFQSYSSGVLTGRCGQRLDHGVLAVGYGTWTDGTPYWKVKNSWGTSWGMDGYILIERSSDDLCGILDAASYPTI